MLSGQNFRRRHNCRLCLVGNCQQSRIEGHYRFARADVTLQEPIHRLRRPHIRGYFSYYIVLVFSEQKRKPFPDSAVDFVTALHWYRC